MTHKLINILFLLIFCFSCSDTNTKEVTVIFSSDQEIQLNIRNAIDGARNSLYISKTICIKPDSSVIYHLDVDGFSYLRFDSEYFNIRQSLLLLEGSTTKIDFIDGKINISGDNSEGQEYLHNNITAKSTGSEVNKLIPIIKPIVLDSINFESLEKTLNDWKISRQYKKDLLEMLDKKLISEKFHTVLSSTFGHHSTTTIAQVYFQLMQGRIKNVQTTKEEYKKIIACLDRLYSASDILNEESTKHLYYFPTDYYVQKYYFLEDEEQSKLNEKYDSSTFGAYIGLMQAPDYVQLAEIGGAAIFDFQNGVGTLYNEELLKWFQEKFPDKEHTTILTKLWENKKEKENRKINAFFLEREVINSFEDISNVKELEEKAIYIDLWASWCSPCLAQFKYNEQTKKLLGDYKNLIMVYISIDDNENDALWKKQINFHELAGYHIRATKSFVDYLSKRLYEGKSVTIPRYILLDKNGEILNDNLPRPSQTGELKKVLDKCLVF